MFLEYIYLSQQDENDITALWQSLAEEGESLNLLGLDYETKSGHFSLGCIQEAKTDNYTRYLYLYHNFAIIVVEQNSVLEDTLSSKISSITNKLSAFEVIGHSTILVNPSETDLQCYKDFYGLNSYKTTRFVNGNLAFYTHELEDFHHLMTFAGNYDKDILTKELPVLLANIFDITQKILFYRDQNNTISYEKTQLDSKIGSIMQLNFVEAENHSSKLEILEEMVGTLANIYTTLSGNASVLLNNQVVLEKDHHITYTQLRKLALEADNFLKENYLLPAEELIRDVNNITKQLQISITNAKTSIEILQAQINLIRSKDNLIIQNQMRQVLNQNLELQQEAVTLQIGAGLIEFIVVMYYSLSIWKTIAPETLHDLPGVMKFGIFFTFAGLVVWVTHKASKYMIKKKNKA